MKQYNTYLIFGLCLISNFLSAQNFKYNTKHFGIKGSMLGGAIVAGTDDMSMTYYNPAAIHNITSRAEISLLRPSISTYGFKQFWDESEQSGLNTNFDLDPLQVSLRVEFKNLEFVFIRINKANWNDQFNTKEELVNNNIQTTRIFEYQYEGRNSWYGVGTSFKLKSNLHLGISQFASFADFTYTNEILTESLDASLNPGEPTQFFRSDTRGEYSSLGLITKIGLIYNTGKHDIGLTITTPTYLPITKSGNFNQATINFDSENSSINQLYDLDLSPTIKTPWEFNLGYSFDLNENRTLWLNAAYHTEIVDYEMAEIASISENKKWINGNSAVFNFGLGYSDQISENFELLGGIRTNNFAYENKRTREGNIRNIILDGNALHFSLGTKFKYKKHTVLLGLDWGTLVDNPNEENYFFEYIKQLNTNMEGLTNRTINILFTYGFVLDELRNLRSGKSGN